MSEDNQESNIFVKSIFGAKSRQPLVSLTFNHVDPSEPMMISPTEARALAANILHASEAAEQDAYLVTFLQQSFGMDLVEAGGVLIDFREQRAASKANSE